MDGYTVIIEAAGESDSLTDVDMARFARELALCDATIVSAGDNSRYGAVILLPDVSRVGEAFVIGLGRFGAAVEFAGLPALPIVRVEVIARHAHDASTPRAPTTTVN
jgi:hypothetical protein